VVIVLELSADWGKGLLLHPKTPLSHASFISRLVLPFRYRLTQVVLEKRPLHTHTHPFNGPFSMTTRASRYQKGKTNLDFTEARDSEWQWHQLGPYASLHLAADR